MTLTLDDHALMTRYFDPGHYLTQIVASPPQDPLGHYLSQGGASGFDPCPGFAQSWYEWQNPDFPDAGGNGFLHYLKIGRHQGRDPSPMVDMLRFSETRAQGLSPEAASDRILRGDLAPGCGIYGDFSDLARNQARFYAALKPVGIRTALPRQKRRNLVFLQAGRAGLQDTWLPQVESRNWDLCVNLYDATCLLPDCAEYAIAQAGTKATAMSIFSSQFREIADGYDYILFLDDDIGVTGAKLDRLFDLCHHYELDAAQMALSEASNCVWPLFFNQGSKGPRYTNGVEIMMPVLSARAFRHAAPLFGQSVSGFGLDLAIGHLTRELAPRNIAVLDEVTAEHLKPIDTAGGGLYSYLRSVGINPKAELWQFVTRYGIDKCFTQIPA